MHVNKVNITKKRKEIEIQKETCVYVNRYLTIILHRCKIHTTLSPT